MSFNQAGISQDEMMIKILADKASRKAAKNERRKNSKKKYPKTLEETFQENPDAFWKNVIHQLDLYQIQIEILDFSFESNKDVILLTTSNSSQFDIEDALRQLINMERNYKKVIEGHTYANNLLQDAIKFQTKFATMSAGYNAKKCCPVPLPSQERLDEIREFYTSQKERLAAHYRLEPRIPE